MPPDRHFLNTSFFQLGLVSKLDLILSDSFNSIRDITNNELAHLKEGLQTLPALTHLSLGFSG